MKTTLTAIILLITTGLMAQKNTVSGYLTDASNGEELIGATIFVEELKTGAVTNVYGFYSISLKPAIYNITYSFIGFSPIKKQVDLTAGNQKISIELGASDVQLQAVEVTAEKKDANVKSVEMSVEKMDMKTLKKIPQVLGVNDIIRSIQLLPGVTSVGEGASGFNVRGGNIDQNLILFDESPVFSSSHLFGFFSVFNADAVKDVKLYKGGIPAKYGGRLSSVLDVRQREGNLKKYEIKGGIGILDARLAIEGPLVKDKVSFLVAGRRSYFDLAFPFANNAAIKDSRLYFYDLNAKINWKISDKDRIFLSGYLGDDVFNFGGDFQTQWGNLNATARWNHVYSDKVFSNVSLVYSDYSYQLGIPDGTFEFDWQANIINKNLKADFSWFPNTNNTVEWGVNAIDYDFRPGKIKGVFNDTNEFEFEVPKIDAVEAAAYISNEQKLGDKITLKYGIRYSHFVTMGKEDIYSYTDNDPVANPNPIDTTSYGDNEIIHQFGGFEPRFSINYLINKKQSVKGSYNRMRQYLHLISNTTAATPVDIWMPAGEFIQPAIADQVALGYFRNFKDNKYEASAEVYYKNFQNLVDYKDAAELLLNERLETELYSGDGRAYGLEMQVKKQRGRFSGWISYTLSRTERQVSQINSGEWYPSNYDKTHDISIVANYDLTERWSLSSSFAYMTGRPITYPNARYTFNGVTVPDYSNRNGARTPAYHRLDAGAVFQLNKSNKLAYTHDLSFGVYNAYGRNNPYSIFFRQDENNPQVTNAFQLAIFAIPIPYVTYNFYFKQR